MWRRLKLWWSNRRALQRGDGIVSGVWLWVDDERPAPPGWYWAKTVEEAQDVLVSCFVERVSLDHDLGPGGEVYDLVKWLAHTREACGLDFWPAERPRVHSMNPVGRDNIEATIERYGRYGGFTPRWHHTVWRP